MRIAPSVKRCGARSRACSSRARGTPPLDARTGICSSRSRDRARPHVRDAGAPAARRSRAAARRAATTACAAGATPQRRRDAHSGPRTRHRVTPKMAHPVLRGTAAQVRDRLRDLAAAWPVVRRCSTSGSVGASSSSCSHDLGVDARGIEVDQPLVATARGRGLDVAVGTRSSTLALDDGSLGGLVMIQVIEHLSPQRGRRHREARGREGAARRQVRQRNGQPHVADRIRRLVLGRSRSRPAGASRLPRVPVRGSRVRRRSSASTARRPGPTRASTPPRRRRDTQRLNANFERINGLLFGPQDYAIVATR